MTIGLVGKRLGEFELIRELGRGGMGVVYEAVQTSLGRRVALKVLGPGLGLTPKAVDRFRREASAAAKLHHTNIVPVYATGEENGIHFYAMELIEGPSLDAVIRHMRGSEDVETKTELPAHLAATGAYIPAISTPAPTSGSSATGQSAERLDRSAAMIADVADALHHAHQQGVTHRDIKPSNLLLSSDGRLSVTDFGLARMLEQPGMTVTGEFVGTPAYMSPEQITAGRIPIDHRTDIYSLGATLYELLTFRPPFKADGRDKLLAMVIQKEPMPPRSIDPRIARDLETICLKCLEKDPDRRYQTAKEMADDLRRYLNRFAIRAKRTGPVGRLKKWVKRNPGVSALGTIVLFASIAAGFFSWQASEEKRLRLEAEQKRANELIVEKRRAALELGMSAAMGADLEAAGKAVAEAELLGASAGETRLLRGLVALYSGHTGEAIEHFEQATRLMPESITPMALLSHAYFEAVEWVAAEKALANLKTLTPNTPQEKMFLAQAIGHVNPTDGLALMDQAMAEKPSAIGHMLRARVRFALAVRTERIADAEGALADSEVAKRQLPRNALPICDSSQAHVEAAAAYRRVGRLDKWDEHLQSAYRDAEELARFPGNFEAMCSRYFTLVIRDGLEGRLDLTGEIREAREYSHGPYLAYAEAYNLFCLGQDAAANSVVEPFPSDEICLCLRIYSTFGRMDGLPHAQRAWEQFTGRNISAVGRYEALQLLWVVGNQAKMSAAVRDLRENRHHFLAKEFDPADRETILAFLDGAASEADLLSKPAATASDEMRLQNLIAWRRLGTGDRAGAEKAFRAAYEMMTFHKVGWWHAKAMLIRMKNPNWPQAIPWKR